jgi:hypothetical protein
MNVLEKCTGSIFSSKHKVGKHEARVCVLLVGSLFGVFFYPEDAGSVCFRNNSEIAPDYVDPHFESR